MSCVTGVQTCALPIFFPENLSRYRLQPDSLERLSVTGLRPPWQPGVAPNPGGKPVAARNRLQGAFLKALADDFEAEGKRAIERCRNETPAQYLRVIAQLMPRELEISRPLDDFSDDELTAALLAARAILAAQADSDAGAGEGDTATIQQAGELLPVPKAT
jgi:hypothetical protein